MAASWDEPAAGSPDATLVEQGVVELEHVSYGFRMFEHPVGGDRHYTAIFVPRGALPLLVECRGIRWDYPGRDITGGPFASEVLGESAADFILVEPCLRGNALRALGETWRAEGDRRDAYAAAADDAAAAVSVALATIPEADGARIFSMGLSRGGTVALLHAARDERIDGVVAMSAPWTGSS